MSSARVPSKMEVMGWGPQQLADYLKRMNLFGSDKVVLKNSISGSRFVNLTDSDFQKFPKLHAPMISKISTEIGKKEERRGLFSKKTTPRYHEPEMAADLPGWAEDEFDDEDFDDDYESPYSGNEDGKDRESSDDDVANDYEPTPSEPPEDHKLCPMLPIGDSEYIDNRSNHMSVRGLPPAVSPRPPASTLSPPSPRMAGESRRDHSPRPAGKQPPQVFRGNKPGRDSGSNSSPIRGPPSSVADRPSTHPWKPQADVPDLPIWSKPPVLPPSSTSINRSNSSARPPPNRFDVKREQAPDEAPKHNTFPLHNKSHPPRPGLPGAPQRHGDSLPPNIPAAGSLPHKLQSVMAEQRGFGRQERQSLRPAQSTTACKQELDPCWYVGKVTRGQAEGCLRRVRMDGAYLVRDGTRQLAGQPFTLMVFYQDKVYNIQIRQQNQQFLLGTGLKAQECFPSVGDIISHYSHSPLLLIDAKNRSSCQQNQCLLSTPSGYYMKGQNWS